MSGLFSTGRKRDGFKVCGTQYSRGQNGKSSYILDWPTFTGQALRRMGMGIVSRITKSREVLLRFAFSTTIMLASSYGPFVARLQYILISARVDGSIHYGYAQVVYIKWIGVFLNCMDCQSSCSWEIGYTWVSVTPIYQGLPTSTTRLACILMQDPGLLRDFQCFNFNHIEIETFP